MVEIFPLENIGPFKKPRRIIKYVLIWCTSGKIVLTVDEKEIELNAHEVLTITSGQFHYVKRTEKGKGYLLEFTLAFFCKDDKDIELIFHNGLFCHFDLNEIIPIPKYQIIDLQLALIEEELRLQPYQYLASVHSRIKLILVEINRSKVNRGDEIYRPDALFLKFLELVRANFKHNYPLQRFAALLGTTEAKLNEQAKIHTGRTAQNVIHGLIISEAKRLLTYQNVTVKETAFKLGFNDPFYFSNFFKKHTRLSPRSYQSKHVL